MFERKYEYEAIELRTWTPDRFELQAFDETDTVYVGLTRKELKQLKKEIGRLLDETKGDN